MEKLLSWPSTGAGAIKSFQSWLYCEAGEMYLSTGSDKMPPHLVYEWGILSHSYTVCFWFQPSWLNAFSAATSVWLWVRVSETPPGDTGCSGLYGKGTKRMWAACTVSAHDACRALQQLTNAVKCVAVTWTPAYNIHVLTVCTYSHVTP